jgi:glucokinase
MLLAGDLGGTKTLLGLFEPSSHRPRQVVSHAYPTQDFDRFTAILDAFARDVGHPLVVDAVTIGVAGPIVDRAARLTNVSFDVSASAIERHLGTTRVMLLNDLEAMAYGVGVLAADELLTLQAGTPHADGNAAVIAAGTGLGQAYLHRIESRLMPVASEGGHADFAARTDREFDLARLLRRDFGRAEVEQVLSGPGLVNIYRLTHREERCDAVGDAEGAALPAAISESALSARCSQCQAALGMFVDAYGAEAGNLGLRAVATAGVFVGGGIAPKILPALQDGRFMNAFRAKAPMSELVEKMPVHVIMNPDAGLVGAAVAAQRLATAG